MPKPITHNVAAVAAEVSRWADKTDDELRDKALVLASKLSEPQQRFVERLLNLHEPIYVAARQAGLKAPPEGNRKILKLLAVERELRRRNPFVSAGVIAQWYVDLIARCVQTGELDVMRKSLNDFAAFQGMAPDQRLNVDITARGLKDIGHHDLSDVAQIHQLLLHKPAGDNNDESA